MGYTNRWTKARAVSATSRQPLSMVSEWPRPLISTISVTPGLRFSRLYEALAIAHGTVWSSSPEMISSGPAVRVLAVDLGLAPRVEVGGGRLEERLAGAGHGELLVQRLGLVLVDGVGEGVAELLVGERDGAVAVGGVARAPAMPTRRAEIGSGSTPRNGAGSIATDAADRPRPARIWVSRPPKLWPITAGLRSSLPMTLAKWSAMSPIDLRANDLGVGLGLGDGVGVVGPAGTHGA